MSITTFDGAVPSTKPARPSLLRRVMGAMIEARERQARRYVNTVLLELDDATLKACGLERRDLVKGGTIYRAL